MRLGALLATVAAVMITAIVLIAVVAGDPDGTAWVDLEEGDCFDLAGALAAGGDDDPLFRVTTVACDEEHDAEVVATGTLNPDGDEVYPDDDELFELVDRRCRSVIGDRLDDRRFGVLPIAPDERTWRGRDGRFACVAVVIGGGTVTAPALDGP